MTRRDLGDPAVTRETPDPKVIEMLVCPMTKTQLVLSSDRTELISRAARLAYPIRQGVPLLSIDEARQISEEELNELK